jgi:hypothetical protein
MIGKCTECGQECNVIIIDFGIGAYEYWGATGIDSQIDAVSDCCEAPAVDRSGHEITVQQLKDNDLPDPEDWDI